MNGIQEVSGSIPLISTKLRKSEPKGSDFVFLPAPKPPEIGQFALFSVAFSSRFSDIQKENAQAVSPTMARMVHAQMHDDAANAAGFVSAPGKKRKNSQCFFNQHWEFFCKAYF